MIFIKADKRFKVGHIVYKDGVLRGHPESVSMKTYTLPPNPDTTVTYIDSATFMKAPPIVVTHEMGEKLKEHFV